MTGAERRAIRSVTPACLPGMPAVDPRLCKNWTAPGAPEHESIAILESEPAVRKAQDFGFGLRVREQAGLQLFSADCASMSPGAIEVVTIRLDLDTEAVLELVELLSPQERHRAARFAFKRDGDRFIVARARLRQLLAARLDLLPRSVEFVYGVCGKPALAPRCADRDLRFNLSHSQDIATYAFAAGHEIGIDIEAIRPIRDADNIADRFFSKCENEAYLAPRSPRKTARILQLLDTKRGLH